MASQIKMNKDKKKPPITRAMRKAMEIKSNKVEEMNIVILKELIEPLKLELSIFGS